MSFFRKFLFELMLLLSGCRQGADDDPTSYPLQPGSKEAALFQTITLFSVIFVYYICHKMSSVSSCVFLSQVGLVLPEEEQELCPVQSANPLPMEGFG